MSGRSIRLSPMQGAILAALKETGEETVATILNTLLHRGLMPTDRESQELAFVSALSGLVRMGAILCVSDDSSGSMGMPGVDREMHQVPDFLEHLHWEAKRQQWHDRGLPCGGRLSVVLTKKGEEVLAN